MKRKLHLLLTLLLLAVCATGGAETTVTYTVVSTSSVKSTDAPAGTTAKYESTFGTKFQLTSGKTMTLTLSGYAGKKITGLKLSMHSNKSGGAGYLDAKIGTKTLASLGSSKQGVTFNQWYDNKNYTLNNTNVTAEVTPTEVNNEDIVITIGATVNSLYCQSFTLTYENASDKPSADLSFNEENYSATLGKTFNAPKLNNPYSVNVSYTSSDEKVATVDASTGKVTLVSSGTTTITAEYNDDNGDYAYTYASYTLNVKDPNEIKIIFSEEGFSDASLVTSVTKGDFTATFSKSSGKTEPAYYDKGSAVRMYDENTLTVSSTTKEISKIEFTFLVDGSSNDYGNLSLSKGQSGTYTKEKNSAGTTSASTWTGLSNSVTFINEVNKSRIQSIKVTFKETASETYTPTTPLTGFAQSGNNYYATFSSDQVTFFPESDENTSFMTDVQKAYAFGDMLELTNLTTATTTIDGNEVNGYFVPANTGVLIKASFTTTTTSIPYYTVSGKNVTALEDNMLYPASKAMSDLGDGYYFYKLAYDDYTAKTGLGFYWGADNGAAFTAKTNGAYLAVSKSTSAKSAFRFDDTTTAISTISTENTMTGNAVYNIQGQRVGANYKGLVIVNGKKIIKK